MGERVNISLLFLKQFQHFTDKSDCLQRYHITTSISLYQARYRLHHRYSSKRMAQKNLQSVQQTWMHTFQRRAINELSNPITECEEAYFAKGACGGFTKYSRHKCDLMEWWILLMQYFWNYHTSSCPFWDNHSMEWYPGKQWIFMWHAADGCVLIIYLIDRQWHDIIRINKCGNYVRNSNHISGNKLINVNWLQTK